VDGGVGQIDRGCAGRNWWLGTPGYLNNGLRAYKITQGVINPFAKPKSKNIPKPNKKLTAHPRPPLSTESPPPEKRPTFMVW